MESAPKVEGTSSGTSALSAGLCLCDDKVRIVYEHGKPSGIRDSGGYLFFFRNIMKYEGQDERYREEREQQQALAEFLLAALQRHNDRVEGRDAASSRRVPSHDELCGNGSEVGAGDTAKG